MAIPKYPLETPDIPLHEFINHSDLKNYALQAEEILNDLKDIGLFVPQIQYKEPNEDKNGKIKINKNTCWYVALKDDPNIWLINLTIVPSNLHIEFRIPKYFTVTEEHQTKYKMWLQNDWPTFGLSNIDKDKAIFLIHEYTEKVRPFLSDKSLKSRNKSSAEYLMKMDLLASFPGRKVRHGERRIPYNNSYLELDLQMPDFNLAIEVQDPTHYKESNQYGNYDSVKVKDEFKKDWCKKERIKFMHIKWDSYMKTLYKHTENQRQEKFSKLISNFKDSADLFRNIEEEEFNSL